MKKHLEIAFVIFNGLLFLFIVLIRASSSNVFQAYTVIYDLSDKVYPSLKLTSVRLIFAIMALSLLKQFQNPMYQRWILVFTMSALAYILCGNVSLYTYPYVTALCFVINTLLEPWRQLMVPPKIRATLEGVIIGAVSIMYFRAVYVQDIWATDLSHYKPLGMGVILFTLVFIIFFKKLSVFKTPSVNQDVPSIRYLLQKSPLLFIMMFYAVFNTGMLSFLYTLSLQLLPGEPVKYYQYASLMGSLLFPMFLGFIADRKGILPLYLITASLLTMLSIVDVALAYAHIAPPIFFYINIFIQSGLIVGLISLSNSFAGIRFREHGIFRVFILVNAIGIMGLMINTRLRHLFSSDFIHYRFALLCVGILILGAIFLAARKEKTAVLPQYD